VQLQSLERDASVLCVEAKQERPQLWLLKDEFDRLTRGILGGFQYERAQQLGLNAAVWSSYRTAARPLSAEFIATAMRLLPNVPVSDYVTTDRTEVPA
jgi:hypothetical protein